MTYRLRLPLLAGVLFCLTSMAGCPNKEPAGQFTVVQGHVLNIRTGQPLPGVLVVLASDDRGTSSYNQVEDSVRTDKQGSYALSFTNKATFYYAISCEGPSYPFYPLYRLDFADSTYQKPPFTGTVTTNLRTIDLLLGKKNQVKFRASPRRVFRVRVTTRNTGYSQLVIDNNMPPRPANNQLFTVLLYQPPTFFVSTSQQFAQQPGPLPGIFFTRLAASGARQDTLVRVVPTTSATADTVEATLQFGR
jgi:5-hydroxyisourate hydrolase-like protein (transthyretin family)